MKKFVTLLDQFLDFAIGLLGHPLVDEPHGVAPIHEVNNLSGSAKEFHKR